MTTGLLLAVPGILFLFGVPIIYALAGSSILYLFITDIPVVAAAQRIYNGLNIFAVTAIPAFMLAGAIMEKSGISGRLIAFAMRGVAQYRAGMAKVTVITSMLFGGMSGAAAADCAAVGSVMIPEMEKRRYPRPYAAALVASAALCAVLIPPSIPLIFYGVLTNTSVNKLLIAGAIPGLLAGIILLITVHFQKIGLNEIKDKKDDKPTGEVLLRAGPVLLLPLIIFAGIFFGWVTATEAAVVAVLYATFLACIVYRTLNIKDLYNIAGQTAIEASTVMLLIGCASLYSWVLSRELIPQHLAEYILSLSDNKLILLLLINVLLLVIGCVLDTASALIIFVAIFFPIVVDLGIDPIHFGVMMVFNLAVGMITPPIGISLMVSASVAKVPMHHLVKPVLPFIGVLLLLLLAVTYIPDLSLLLVKISSAN